MPKGTATEPVVNQLWQAAIDEGVRQSSSMRRSMIETVTFALVDVLPEQCSFSGVIATGNGARGLSFDTVLKGLRAGFAPSCIRRLYEPLTVDPSKARDVDPPLWCLDSF